MSWGAVLRAAVGEEAGGVCRASGDFQSVRAGHALRGRDGRENVGKSGDGVSGLRTGTVGAALLLLLLLVGSAAYASQGAGGGESNPFASVSSSASVSYVSGDLSYSVPLDLPAARLLVTPSLSLGYSSRAGLGPVGFGWSLSAGSIRRATKDGVPRCNGANMNDFISISAGSAGRLVEMSSGRYMFETDEAYSVAESDEVANSWILTTREGLRYTFGGAEPARVYSGSDDFYDVASCAFTTAWYVTKVEDTNGNYAEFEYEKFGNMPILRWIHYGGNAPASIPHAYRVEVVTEDLATIGKPLLRNFSTGVEQQLTKRVTDIIVSGKPTRASAFTEIRSYTLVYDGDTEPTRDFFLESISATGLPDRVFVRAQR